MTTQLFEVTTSIVKPCLNCNERLSSATATTTVNFIWVPHTEFHEGSRQIFHSLVYDLSTSIIIAHNKTCYNQYHGLNYWEKNHRGWPYLREFNSMANPSSAFELLPTQRQKQRLWLHDILRCDYSLRASSPFRKASEASREMTREDERLFPRHSLFSLSFRVPLAREYSVSPNW